MELPHSRSRRRRNQESPSNRPRSASPIRSPDLGPSSSTSHSFSTDRGSQGRNTIPPCDRCRSFKKKCSRTFPSCTLCAHASQICSYSALATTPEAEAVQLRGRVQWFSDFINRHILQSSNGVSIEDVDTGTDLASLLGSRLNLDPANSALQGYASTQGVLIAMPSSDVHPLENEGSLPLSHERPGTSDLGPLNDQIQPEGDSNTSPSDWDSVDRQTSFQSPVGTHDLGDTVARRFVDAYFRNVDGAYPLVNRTKVLENLEAMGDLAQRLRDSQSTLLYLIMSIGCTTLERASQVSRKTAKRFEVAYAEIIQECVCQNSIESVQILMLLALYSLFDPAGPSAYSIVGIAARQAIKIGLTRRSAEDDSGPPAEKELRYRLYWSIFALDSMMAVSLGLPAALSDNADVPLPSLTVEEFASTERVVYARKLQTSRHVIQLRQLERRILEKVHFKTEVEIAKLEPLDRRATLGGLRASIEDWYSQGCLMSPMGGDDSTVHSSTTWLNARYYHLLVLLYYPNHFNNSARAVSQQDLQQFAQRQLQATWVLFQQQQLPLNCNTLCRLMPICLLLMYSFMGACHSTNWTAQSTFTFLAKDEVSIAQSVLEAFPKEWNLAHRAAQVMGQFAGVVLGGLSALSSDKTEFLFASRNGPAHADQVRTPGEGCNGREDLLGFTKPCIARLTSLMQELLGKSTCFQWIEYTFNDDKQMVDTTSPPSHQQLYQRGGDQHGRLASQAEALNRNEMDSMEPMSIGNTDVMGYGWGAIDLDFL